LIKEKEQEEVILEERHWAHEVEQEIPHESIEEEGLDEAHHVEGQVHEGLIESTTPREEDMLAFSPPFDEDEVTQDSSPPSHEDNNMVSCTLF